MIKCETMADVRALQEQRDEPIPFAPDWVVQFIVDRAPNARLYRWLVAGINANCAPGGYGRVFYWEVPALSWRYDLTTAQLVTEREARGMCVKDDPAIRVPDDIAF